MIIWTIVNSALFKVFGNESKIFRCAEVNFHLFRRNSTLFFRNMNLFLVSFLFLYSPPHSSQLPCVPLPRSFSWVLFLWGHWISFNSFCFIFLHLILYTTRQLCYKFRESWLIRNMLFPLGFPALCTPGFFWWRGEILWWA